ncbi:hypothetical protein WBG78_29680 [Chryseolinea sp. T2]|uniref:hypothetical protein n=1 Tax=Chryseolinea sp. T2 TaxID=3129255 RepID=UPI003078A02F
MNTKFLKRSSTGMILAIFLMLSCKEEDRLTLGDTQEITEESVTDSYFLDLDDMATVAIAAPSDNQYSGGRVATTITITDSRFCANAVVTITPGPNSTLSSPNGVLTVDFGSGCTDARGNVRTGKLIFTYNKWRFQPGSTIITTTNNYTINGWKLEGTRTLTNLNSDSDDETVARKFSAVLENGKATFVDGTTALRESDITWQWNRATNAADDFLTILETSSASGTTTDGSLYDVMVYESLIYKRNCGIAVSGIKKYSVNKKEITIDYGDGNCDKSVVVTVNGTSRNYTIN